MISVKQSTIEQTKALRAIIVENEQLSLSNLKQLLFVCCKNVNVVAEATSIQEALARFRDPTLELDVAFLDIHLSDGLAFQLLPTIKDRGLEVIFCTAYHQYAVKAFQLNAIHYLMKPFDPDLLKEAVNRVIVKKTLGLPNHLGSLDKPNPGYNGVAKLILSANDGTYVIDHSEIIRCQGDDNYTDLFLTGGKKLKSTLVLKKIVEELGQPGPFYRVHKGHLINVNHMTKYVSTEDPHVVMNDGAKIPVSRRRKKYFRDFLNSLG